MAHDPQRKLNMDIQERAMEIENAIKLGNYEQLKGLVDDISDISVIRSIEENFLDRDPVVCAIHYREENIALYLVEKGFNYKRAYNYPGRQCDEWCFYNHGDDPCPTEYDALDLAAMKRLTRIHQLIMNIGSGLRKPGDGLALSQNPVYKREDSSMSNRSRGVSAGDGRHTDTKGGLARKHINELGLGFLSKTGETVMHMCDSATMVHVCASLGVPINAANFDGDTALHLAVRRGQREVCQALLMNGADPNQKNKLGQTPADETNGYTRDLLDAFKPGLLQVVNRGEYNSLQRLIRLWCNPHSSISRDGKSAMEILKSLRKSSEGHNRAFSVLNAQCKTLEVTHAVLSEDVKTLKKLLRTEKGWTLNKRYKGGLGETLVSCAIDQHNLEVVQLLVETTKCQLNLRVMETQQADCRVSVPLLFRTLEEDCPEEIWSYIDREVDVFQTREKDLDGNTAVLRALVKGRSARFLHSFIRRHPTTCLTERNKDGLNLRELAKEMNRHDVIGVIDDFIRRKASFSFLSQFPVAFYGYENLPCAEQVQSVMSRDQYNTIEEIGTAVHEAAALGNLKALGGINNADFRDKNGYTALIRAIVNLQLAVAENLITERPTLKSIPDNCNRYPLHYAYALPEDKGEAFVKLLLARNPEDIEFKLDKCGREAVEYQDLRDTEELQEMMRDALTLNTRGERHVQGGLTTTPVSQHTEEVDLYD